MTFQASRVVIGIDPGLKGAIAVLFDGDARVHPVPVVASAKDRDTYDLGGIVRLLAESKGVDTFCMIEKLQPMPNFKRRCRGAVPEPDEQPCTLCGMKPGSKEESFGGGIASFNRGKAVLYEMACVALRIPYELVAPRTWQKVMHAGTSGTDTKQRSIVAAQRLFPAVDLRRTPRSRKQDDGIAEALLLAAYGQRTHGVASATA